MMTLLICTLATFRLVRLVTIEEGPFRLALWLRGVIDPDQTTWIGRGLACPWCISFWMGPLAVWAAQNAIGYVVVSGLAVSACVGLGYQGCGYLLHTLELWRRKR